MTNFGATLQAVLLGMTGLRFGAFVTEPTSRAEGRVAALPLGWDNVTVNGLWLGGKRYRVVAVHGEPAQISAMV